MSDNSSSDEEVILKPNRRAIPDITVEDSDSGDEIGIGNRFRKKMGRAKLILDSSDEDDEKSDRSKASSRSRRNITGLQSSSDDDEAERYAFSPRTRRSIGFLRPVSADEGESSEIDYSGNESKHNSHRILKANSFSTKNESIRTRTESDDNDDDDDSGSTNDHKNSNLEKDVENDTNGQSESQINASSDSDEEIANSYEENKQLIKEKTISSKPKSFITPPNESFAECSSAETVDIFHSAGEDQAAKYDSPTKRYTMNFERSIRNQLSSTICEPLEEAETPIQSSNVSTGSDEVQLISVQNNPIEILSSDDDSVKNNANTKNTECQFVQPTIQTAFSNMPPPKQPPPSAKKTPGKSKVKLVSKEFYEKEKQKLVELKVELTHARSLVEKMGSSLPDGGLQLRLRCDRLQADIDIKAKFLSSLQIEDASNMAQPKQSNGPSSIKAPNWDELSSAVNEVKPVFTGTKGLAKFNVQKALTVDRLKVLHGSLESCPAETELADNPEGLKIGLMTHQRHGLKWMMWREKQKPRGGILADDMGLGKTLSMISLILASKNRREAGEEEDQEDFSDSEEDEEAQSSKGWSSKGRKTYYKGGTLVVCPASLIKQWEAEVLQRVSRNRLTVCVHHGNNRDTRAKNLRTYDMVVTTYNIVSREMETSGALFGLQWHRIILDEAHVIRNHKSKMSLGACKLRGICRWALTGTPVQNRENDVYPLIKFLRCSPFDDLTHWKMWINKGTGGTERLNTIMKTILLRRTKQILQDQGELNCLPKKETKLIEVELQKDEMNVYQKVMIYSRTLFAQFLYQRAERNSDLMYTEDAKRPAFLQSKDPNGAYYKLHQKFTRMHKGGDEVKSHEILVLLLRLRQICCHPGLIDAMLEDDDSNLSSDCNATQPEIDLLDQLNKLAIKDTSEKENSTASMQNSLENDVMDNSGDRVFAKASAKVMQRSNPVFHFDRPSSKIVRVLETLKKCITGTNDKVIVVSQWRSVLDIIKRHLAKQNIASLSLDGSVPVKNRQDIVDEFNRASSSVKVLLLSLTAGGVGLNLIGANHLLLTDMHWNPQLESQAQDRIYRVGQKKDVTIYKFMCKDTVEERIKALQDNKLSIANDVLNGAKGNKGSKLTIDELKGLFDLS